MVFMSINGGPSRCYNFLMDFLKCVQDDGNDQPALCKAFAEDYMECLHHRKYFERQMMVDAEKRRQEAEAAAPPKAHH